MYWYDILDQTYHIQIKDSHKCICFANWNENLDFEKIYINGEKLKMIPFLKTTRLYIIINQKSTFVIL